VLQYESTKRVKDLEAIERIKSAPEVGTSYLPNIQKQIDELGAAEFVVLRLGPTPWWDTRLHLTAALASDFTEIRAFVVLDEWGRFLTMAPPAEIRRALAKAAPKLEMVYLQSQDQAHNMIGDSSEVDRIIFRYPDAVRVVFGKTESDVKKVVTWVALREVRPEGEVIEQISADHQLITTSDLLRRRARYLVVMREGNLEGVIDRAELASRIAGTVL
jgi:hypothetical protein